jgi:phosphoribosylformimino-5-aminoimidazole carboxamide ribotide isomerase
MELYPAIDLRAGRCVRLVEGDFDRETVYDDDPLLVAREFVSAGARWIHVVDLDAARRQGDNRLVIAALAAALPIPIEVGGGVRDGSLLEIGVARVVVGSLAVEDPSAVRALAAAYPGRVAAGVDHRHGSVRVRGWEQGAGVSVAEVIAALEDSPLAAVIVTEIGRDGTLAGPDTVGLAAVLATTALPVIASGGVSTLADLRALAHLEAGAGGGRRLAGVIVGKALYERRFGVAEARGALDAAAAGWTGSVA